MARLGGVSSETTLMVVPEKGLPASLSQVLISSGC